ncbi:MAG TPA: hypothetical protein VK752_19535 [Bryobacteraceae bacterium]|jgi:hypothetical protein|nr:hypothetical protein [Bryobacteraceae bacterium]
MLLLPYLLIAAGLLATVGLFMTLKREIRRQAQREKKQIAEILVRLDQTSVAEPAVHEMPVPAPLRAGLNLNRRVHAMRMLRRGEDVSHVAAALGVPRKEVELLIRVQAIGKARIAMLLSNEPRPQEVIS